MPRDLPLGNGNMLVAFDKSYLLREFYFPFVGQENHTQGHPFRFGVWIEGKFSWIPEGWDLTMDYLDDSLVAEVFLKKESEKLTLHLHDVVDFHENIYLKRITVENRSDQERQIRFFLAQDFHISGNDIGDTALFRPELKCLLHYKGERYFLINVLADGKYGIDQYATGNNARDRFEGGWKGTWKDAEDGLLSGNPIAQGSVDSVLGISMQVAARSTATCYYWIAAGKNWDEVVRLDKIVKKKGPEEIFKRTASYWQLWVNKEGIVKNPLPEKIERLYKRSLLITRTQINNCGSIIAANDSDVINFNRDTYSYMWPRDGALVAHALDSAGYGLTVHFFNFCSKIISKEGYFLHKYTPSGSLASSWHPWIKGSRAQLPIQEDETALILWALWNHYETYRDIEFIKPLYKNLIKRAADFMMTYRDLETGLPLPSYDLWEERQGVFTFTTSAVYGGLLAAANFTEAFGERELAAEYRAGAEKLKQAMVRYLYLEKEGRFGRGGSFNEEGKWEIDPTVDASLYGLFAFGVYDAKDEKVMKSMEAVQERLWHPKGGGVARYENDTYYLAAPGRGNPWFVTTLWLAHYYIEIGELAKALSILEWVADHALKSGVLAEQVNPETHEPISVSPLTWSHATFIHVVQAYRQSVANMADEELLTSPG